MAGCDSPQVFAPDFRLLFESTPALLLVLAPDPDFTIVAASDAYLAATMTRREEVVGRGLFDAFPDNPADPAATGTANLRASLERALASRQPDAMPVQKYDVRHPREQGGAYEVRYWRPLNTPVTDAEGKVRYLVHRVEDVTELVRTRAEADRHRLLTSQVKEYAIFMLDPAGRVTSWNDGAQRLKGYTPSEILGKHFSCFYPPEDVEAGRPQQLLERAAAQGHAEDEGWRVRKDGSRFWADVVVTVVHDAQGRLLGFAKVTRDLSEKKRRQDLLRQWEHLFEHAQWGIAIVDARLQTLRTMNPAFAAMHGYTVDALVGQPLSQLIAPGYEQQSARHIRTVLERRHHNFEIAHRRRDGSQFPVLVDATAVQATTGAMLYEAVQVQDITERKRQEDEQRFLAQVGVVLAGTRNMEESLGRVASMAVPLLADCCIVDLLDESRLPRRIKAIDADPRHRPEMDALEQPPAAQGRPLVWNVLEPGESILQGTLDDAHLGLLAPDASQRETLRALAFGAYVAVPLRVRERTLGAMFFLLRPPRGCDDHVRWLALELGRRVALAVDNAQQYAAAQRAIQAREFVLRVVAHDLRNPLASIKLSAQRIERAASRAGAVSAFLGPAQTIVTSVRSADRLIRDLLDIARLEEGRMALESAPQRPATLLEDVDTLVRPLAESAGIDFVREEAPDVPLVRADRERVLQVLSNLVGNALKFAPRGGRVVVGAAAHDEEVWFHVTDTGPGIPPEQRAHLFDHFWQARPADRRGIGLGLAIAKGIVDAHGGRMWVESTLGQGTTVLFALPVASTPEPARRGPDTSAEESGRAVH